MATTPLSSRIGGASSSSSSSSPSSASSAPSTSTPVCRFFQSPSGCYRGESCAFLHVPVTEHANGNAPMANSPQQAALPNGTDTTGNAHSASTFVKPNVYVPAAMGGGPMMMMMPSGSLDQALRCRYFLTEQGCRNGAMCPFAHVNTSEVNSQASCSPCSDPINGNGNGNSIGNGATTAPTTTRRKVDIQANPQKTPGNHEMLSEVIPVLTRGMEGPFFAIDVECVATGKGTLDRDVARIAMVDEHEQVFFDQYVKPDKPIVSYLTQLTGITERDLRNAPSLKEALVKLRAILPKNSVIVGQSINKDLTWLGLEQDVDYKQMFDVADLFRIPMLTNGSIHYRYFSLRHVAKYLLGTNIQEADHDPVIDAKYAMKVFKQFRYLHETPAHRDAVYQTLLKTPRTPSFADRYPVIDGVDMRPKKRFPKRRQFHPGGDNA